MVIYPNLSHQLILIRSTMATTSGFLIGGVVVPEQGVTDSNRAGADDILFLDHTDTNTLSFQLNG